MPVTAILDIGKTNIKLCLLDAGGATVWSRSRHNATVDSAPYPHFDVEGLWHWLLAALAEAAQSHRVVAINVSTHGACAVLVGADGELALPVLDYEFTGVEQCNAAYDPLRPAFSRSCSPRLPAGLNLGRQLFWLRQNFPAAFDSAARLLTYPQYWVWRLTGIAVAEVTSLGCHTDLWCPVEAQYSPLVDALGIRTKLPTLVGATENVGCVTPALAATTGLPADCRVFPGVHDSNASFARHLAGGLRGRFAVVSTGTWVITMAAGTDLSVLDEARDTLANVSVLGEPLACARFMGGREFEEICRLTGAAVDDDCSEDDVAQEVAAGHFALPAFAMGGGPFIGRAGELPPGVDNGKALATLYLALMIDYELDLLGAQGDTVFGSSSQKNPLLCRLLAQLRRGQAVLMSGDAASTVRGAWCLTRPGFPAFGELNGYERAAATAIGGLAAYRQRWREQLAGDIDTAGA